MKRINALQNARGFSLIEILLVIAIIALLLALLFPVFAKVQEKARHTACLSSLRQIGVAVSLYTSDNDDQFPLGGNQIDFLTESDEGAPAIVPDDSFFHSVKPLPEVLSSYTKVPTLWSCPSDKGLNNDDKVDHFIPKLCESAFDEYKTSYFYRGIFVLYGKSFSSLAGYAMDSHRQYGSADIAYLFDMSGRWHGSMDGVEKLQRFNSLFIDGHVKSLKHDDYIFQFNVHYQ